MPIIQFMLLVVTLIAISTPGTSFFTGNFFILFGSYQTHVAPTIGAAVIIGISGGLLFVKIYKHFIIANRHSTVVVTAKYAPVQIAILVVIIVFSFLYLYFMKYVLVILNPSIYDIVKVVDWNKAVHFITGRYLS